MPGRLDYKASSPRLLRLCCRPRLCSCHSQERPRPFASLSAALGGRAAPCQKTASVLFSRRGMLGEFASNVGRTIGPRG